MNNGFTYYPNKFLSNPRAMYEDMKDIYQLFIEVFPEDQIPVKRSSCPEFLDITLVEYFKFMMKLRPINFNKEFAKWSSLLKESLMEIRRVCDLCNSSKHQECKIESEIFSTYFSWIPKLFREVLVDDSFQMDTPFIQPLFPEFKSLVPNFKSDNLIVICKHGIIENKEIFKQLVIALAYSLPSHYTSGVLCDGQFIYLIDSQCTRNHEFELSDKFELNSEGICSLYSSLLNLFIDDLKNRNINSEICSIRIKIEKEFKEMYTKMKPLMVDICSKRQKLFELYYQIDLSKYSYTHSKLTKIKERSENILNNLDYFKRHSHIRLDSTDGKPDIDKENSAKNKNDNSNNKENNCHATPLRNNVTSASSSEKKRKRIKEICQKEKRKKK